MSGKINGLGCQLWVSGYDLGDDIRDVQVGSPMTPIDVTPITKSAMVRIGGHRDGSMQVTAFANVDTAQAHARFSPLASTDGLMSFAIGSTAGLPVANLLGKQINYDPTRAATGELTFAVDTQGSGYGLEWCTQLTAGKRTDTAATNGSSVDLGSASPGAFGAQFYLHVFSFTGTSVTVKIQESSDNGAGDAFADVVGGGFTAATGATFQRIATGSINVERYLRVVTTGTFSSAIFAVSGTRNPAAVAF
jgi:hypothetical protein